MKAYDFSFLYISVCYPFSILATAAALVVQLSSDLHYLSHSLLLLVLQELNVVATEGVSGFFALSLESI